MSEVTELATAILSASKSIENYESEIKRLRVLREEKEEDLITILTGLGDSNTGDIPGVGRLSLCRSIYPTINACDLQQFIDSLRDSKEFNDIVKETIEPRVLKKFLKKEIDSSIKEFTELPNLIESFFPGSHFTASEAAKEVWKRRGVRVFTKIGLKWTKKES